MDVQVVGQLLQLAVAAADTDSAVGVVLAEDQTQIGLTGLADTRGVGADDHAVLDLGVAGGSQALHSLHFHHAHTAGGNLIDLFQIAQVRNGDAGLFGGFQNGCAVCGGQLAVIDLKFYHFSTRPPLKFP